MTPWECRTTPARKGRSPARSGLRAPGTDEARLVTMVLPQMFERTDLHAVETAFSGLRLEPHQGDFPGNEMAGSAALR
jgi:hypothetical protein